MICPPIIELSKPVAITIDIPMNLAYLYLILKIIPPNNNIKDNSLCNLTNSLNNKNLSILILISKQKIII